MNKECSVLFIILWMMSCKRLQNHECTCGTHSLLLKGWPPLHLLYSDLPHFFALIPRPIHSLPPPAVLGPSRFSPSSRLPDLVLSPFFSAEICLLLLHGESRWFTRTFRHSHFLPGRALSWLHSNWKTKSPFRVHKKTGSGPIKKCCPGPIFVPFQLVTLVRLMAMIRCLHCWSVRTRPTRKRRYGTRSRLHSALEQQKGVRRTHVFSPVPRSWPPMASKPEKSGSGFISWKRGTDSLRGKNIWSVPAFYWVRTYGFFSVEQMGVNKPPVMSLFTLKRYFLHFL